MEEVAHDIEDRTLQDHEALFDGLVPDGLNDEACSRARWADEQGIAVLTHEPARGQVEDLLLREREVEGPIEFIQRTEFSKRGGFDAAVEPRAVLCDRLRCNGAI